MSIVEEIRRDFTRHGASLKNPAFWAIATYRVGRWGYQQPVVIEAITGKVYGALAMCVELASGITLHREAEIGDDLHLVHAGNIKIHPQVKLGHRVGIMHDVTLGTVPERDGAPIIGDDVFIGAGAKILGPVHIGDGARIAANSLVVTDVPAGATAIGVPARVMQYSGRSPAPNAPAAQAPAVPTAAVAQATFSIKSGGTDLAPERDVITLA